MRKIPLQRPLVEIDGDEMARVMWAWIKESLILPYVEGELLYFDLGIRNRDATGDQVTLEAARATLRHGVAVKCATITHDLARMHEFGSPAMLPSPNATFRNVLNGTVFREPICCRNIPRLVPHWDQPIVIARHAFGDHSNATQIELPGPGTLTLRFAPDGDAAAIEREVCRVDGSGIAMAMYNLDASITGFARAVFRYGLLRQYPVYLSTKHTIIKTYDGRFSAIFQDVFEREFAQAYREAGLTYEHRLIDDMVASALKWRGGYIWACKNYDGDVQSDTVAQGFGSLGLMTSVLVTPDGGAFEAEAAHGTVTRHYREHQAGRETSTNPIASIFAWTRGLRRRAELDETPDLAAFASALERACIATVEAGCMTRDLATLVSPDHPWVSTRAFLERVAATLRRELGA
ncbi:NADP-dependent isocitrate dehydrogenase [uncultured Pigmentiphaga sp.]|uniref:NADP-dependent isocitrate dehydrogenase n=1 Tax=uncultured Pigmentiphaga sp. TaxID=340361 RepID=UPI00260DA6FA|nr:NADP-dependent isocitrate dehydrogenase [uncultured Pigmentiphaga sp.]